MGDIVTILAVALVAAIASPAGGLVAIAWKPSTLFMSLSIGFAGGTLLGTVAFKMMPDALTKSSIAICALGFVVGFAITYVLDLQLHRGRVAGEAAAERQSVQRYYRRHPPLGDKVTVLAAGTSMEELIEGLTIGVSAASDPSLGILVGAAIALDNFTEALGIGELTRAQERGGDIARGRILKWTGLIGASLFGAALVGWYFLQGIAEAWLGFLTAVGAGGMVYLTVTDLVPEADKYQYQQSAAVAFGAGFLLAFVVSRIAESG